MDIEDICYNTNNKNLINQNINKKYQNINNYTIYLYNEFINFYYSYESYIIFLKNYGSIYNKEKIYKKKFDKILRYCTKKYKICPKISLISLTYKELVNSKIIKKDYNFEKYIVVKKIRQESGVLVVTTFMSDKPFGQDFTCNWNCSFCPSEPGQPKSYLSDEPGVQRGKRNNFDPIKQFNDRISTHWINGHPISKIEILILGGTYHSYQPDYCEDFIKKTVYAANTYFNKEKRGIKTLDEEMDLNKDCICKIIGITIETRPDCININNLLILRKLNVTRIQMGLQHVDDDVLKINERGHNIKHSIRGIQMAMDFGFKVDIHIMPRLMGTTPEKDKLMFERLLSDLRIQADQWKIYPTQVTPFTLIEKKFKSGEYKPYGSDILFNMLIEFKKKIPPWIRNNRIIRDFPSQYDIAKNTKTNLRNDLHIELEKQGYKCQCIRCSQVKDNTNNIRYAKLVIRNLENEITNKKYIINGVNNYFLSYESCTCNICWKYYLNFILSFINLKYDCNNGRILYGFLRLRITNNKYKKINELDNTALIRELHVYGKINPPKSKLFKSIQHQGIGKKLMKTAEYIAINNNCNKIAVISGIGVRDYYNKLGYKLYKPNNYMIKNLEKIDNYYLFFLIIVLIYIMKNHNLLIYIRI